LQQDIALILDDYHVIEAHPIHSAMTFLLDHLPLQLHLVIASRSDPPLPLSRLRVRHQLIELRADDLRFSLDEAAAFLNDIMNLHLTSDDIATLEARTDGLPDCSWQRFPCTEERIFPLSSPPSPVAIATSSII
jgi:LuxR family maltose regulon positive regulatory protein